MTTETRRRPANLNPPIERNRLYSELAQEKARHQAIIDANTALDRSYDDTDLQKMLCQRMQYCAVKIQEIEQRLLEMAIEEDGRTDGT